MRRTKRWRTALLTAPAAAAAAAVMRSVAMPAPADATTINWTNSAGGNYSTPGNWSAGGPPTATDTAVFTAAGTYNVTLDTNPSNDDMRHSSGNVTFLNSVA